MTITKQLSRDDLLSKIDKGGLLHRRPDLAVLVMRGDCAYEERRMDQSEGENFALAGSPAAHITKDLTPEPPAPSRGMSDEEAERRMEEIRRRHAPHTSTRAPAVSTPPVRPSREQEPDASEAFLRTVKARAGEVDSQSSGDASTDFIRSAEALANGGHRAVGAADVEIDWFGGAA